MAKRISKKVAEQDKILISSSVNVIKNMLIDDFLNNEVRTFGMYVVKTRALPNIMDGLKVGARKIMYTMINNPAWNKGQKDKLSILMADSAKLSYHHGENSLKGTIEVMSAPHIFHCTPFEFLGTLQTLRSPEVSTAARYVSIRRSKNVAIFEKDLELLSYTQDDGKFNEPDYFLPIIPTALLWRTNSPGFGFSYRSFSFDINTIIDATLSSVLHGSCTGFNNVILKPYVEGINPDNFIYNEHTRGWYNIGEYTIDETKDLLHIHELPYDVSYSKYNEILNTLKDKFIIEDFFNSSTDGKINYTVKFAKGMLKRNYASKWKFYNRFKLVKKLMKLTLNVVDNESDGIITFENENALVEGFVRRRLKFYEKRKSVTAKALEEEMATLNDRVKFIELIITEQLKINKRAIKDIKADLDKFKVSHAGLQLPISRLTKDEIEKITDKIKSLKAELAYILKTPAKELYVKDLIELKEKVGSPIIDMQHVK